MGVPTSRSSSDGGYFFSFPQLVNAGWKRASAAACATYIGCDHLSVHFAAQMLQIESMQRSASCKFRCRTPTPSERIVWPHFMNQLFVLRQTLFPALSGTPESKYEHLFTPPPRGLFPETCRFSAPKGVPRSNAFYTSLENVRQPGRNYSWFHKENLGSWSKIEEGSPNRLLEFASVCHALI